MKILRISDLDNKTVSVFIPSIKECYSFWCNKSGAMTFESDKYPLLKISNRLILRENNIHVKKNIYTLSIYEGEICMLAIGRTIYDKLINFIANGNMRGSALIDLSIRMEMKSSFPSYDNSLCSAPDMNSFDKEKLQSDYNNNQNYIEDFIRDRVKWYEHTEFSKHLEENCDISLNKYQMDIRGDKLEEILNESD